MIQSHKVSKRTLLNRSIRSESFKTNAIKQVLKNAYQILYSAGLPPFSSTEFWNKKQVSVCYCTMFWAMPCNILCNYRDRLCNYKVLHHLDYVILDRLQVDPHLNYCRLIYWSFELLIVWTIVHSKYSVNDIISCGLLFGSFEQFFCLFELYFCSFELYFFSFKLFFGAFELFFGSYELFFGSF